MCHAAFVPITTFLPFLDHAGRHDARRNKMQDLDIPATRAGAFSPTCTPRGFLEVMNTAKLLALGERSKPGAWESAAMMGDGGIRPLSKMLGALLT